FIENLGQFNEQIPGNEKVLFGSSGNGIDYFFTENGIVFRYFTNEKRSRKELNVLLREKEKYHTGVSGKESRMEEERERELLAYKQVPHYITMHWQNANMRPGYLVQNQIATKYLYPHPVTRQTISARAFKKLVLYEIYSGIDVEFYFPADSAGIKYNYIVKEGASPALIREAWGGDMKINLETNGTISVRAPEGKLTLNKPVSYTADARKSISTNYVLQKEIVSYQCSMPASGSMVIDPWTVPSSFGAADNTGFDVDYDTLGNCYAYGGPAPFTVLKFNSGGSLVWSYATSTFSTGASYGDFAVDHNTGSCYMIRGFTSPDIVKIYSSGTFAASYYASALQEMWRVVYDQVTNHIIIGAGLGSNQIGYMDSSLTTLTTHNVIGAGAYADDVVLLALDDYGAAYFLPGYWTPTAHDNHILKTDVPGFSSLIYSVPSGYKFLEALSPNYGPFYLNGFNGIAIKGQRLFTYDSYVLKKRNSVTGNVMLSWKKNIAPGGDSTHMDWGGITVDDCYHVFIGSHDTVLQYDTNFVLENVYPVAGTVIDVIASPAGKIYVTGSGFVAQLDMPASCSCSILNPGLSVTNASCYEPGSAFVNPTGVTGYTVSWSTTPVSVGDSVFNLLPGDYTVTVSDSACPGNEISVDFTVGFDSGAFSATTVVQEPSCNGFSDGTIAVNTIGGVAPFTYSWTPSSLTGAAVAGIGVGTYAVTITDSNGCSASLTVVVDEPLVVSASVSPTTIDCNGGTGDFTVLPTGGTGPYSVVWNTTPPVPDANITDIPAGSYSITVTDSNGCVHTFTQIIGEPPALTLSIAVDSVGCLGSPLGSMTATAGGGTGAYNYLWSNNPSNNTPVNSGLAAGIYTLTVTDDNGCTITQTDTVFELDFPSVIFMGNEPCNSGSNGSIAATPSGGSGGTTFNYSWNTTPVQTGLNAAGLSAGTYVLTVSANGCSTTFTTFLGENAVTDTLNMQGVICNQQPFIEVYLPGIAQPMYQWFLSGTPVTGANGSTFNAQATDLILLSASWFYNGCKYTSSTTQTAEYPVASAREIPNVFSPNGDGLNESFFPFVFIPVTDQPVIDFLFKSFTMQVYNRWGQLMYASTNPNQGWKGDDLGGSAAAAGVYYVVIRYESLCSDQEGEILYNGTVQLVR
ncbi:MAG TPA: gliding motility-associated C-terminal domain-containing protein, partial [Flavobacteriales bacterium]|nr:gliding motility-associated C-terminal domain-containing protein [Flavobacteriales bacterium]